MTTTERQRYDLSAYDADHITARGALNQRMIQATRDYITAMAPLALEEAMFQKFVRGIWSEQQALREVTDHVYRLADEAKDLIAQRVDDEFSAYMNWLKGV